MAAVEFYTSGGHRDYMVKWSEANLHNVSMCLLTECEFRKSEHLRIG